MGYRATRQHPSRQLNISTFPLISVIIPVYNVEEYLSRCLDSIMGQTHAEWEALLVDDGSTDGSGKICDEYAARDSRFRVFHKTNGGVSSARNVGLREARGECVCFIDADDFVHPRYLEILQGALLSTQADIAICGYVKTFDGVCYSEETVEPVKTRKVSYQDFLNHSVSYHNHVCAKLYRKKILKGYFFEEAIRYSEDAVFNFRLICGTDGLKMRSVGTPLYYYYNRQDSVINTSSRMEAFAEIYWYLDHWEVFLPQYAWIVCEHAMKTILQIRMELYLTPAYRNVTERWAYLSGSLIEKMKSVGNMPKSHQLKYYTFLKCFWLYRLLLIIKDPTLMKFENEKSNNGR